MALGTTRHSQGCTTGFSPAPSDTGSSSALTSHFGTVPLNSTTFWHLDLECGKLIPNPWQKVQVKVMPTPESLPGNSGVWTFTWIRESKGILRSTHLNWCLLHLEWSWRCCWGSPSSSSLEWSWHCCWGAEGLLCLYLFHLFLFLCLFYTGALLFRLASVLQSFCSRVLGCRNLYHGCKCSMCEALGSIFKKKKKQSPLRPGFTFITKVPGTSAYVFTIFTSKR